MSDLAAKMLEDRALRDAARALVAADIALMMENLDQKGLGTRVKDSVSETAESFTSDLGTADEKPGLYLAGGLIGIVVLWFSRKPVFRLLGWFFSRSPDEADEEDPGIADEGSYSDEDPVAETNMADDKANAVPYGTAAPA
ncbi:hypothetical protein D6851_14560 [Altericroceibacterium spongiae]|uniref:DUF3618 domain-containing protein n=1 Tax=Altericroceibacterium spongiae TaxID=2320269 RepID=A0A420ECC6_9SPHN|nr:hypothetical protein [Altericroceibacterium spongiae]RKF18359.1 hypothetical protein D6851_14560 [Altericroceibacterium spongiae]